MIFVSFVLWCLNKRRYIERSPQSMAVQVRSRACVLEGAGGSGLLMLITRMNADVGNHCCGVPAVLRLVACAACIRLHRASLLLFIHVVAGRNRLRTFDLKHIRTHTVAFFVAPKSTRRRVMRSTSGFLETCARRPLACPCASRGLLCGGCDRSCARAHAADTPSRASTKLA